MALNFDFYTAPEIFFGRGRIMELPTICEQFGKKILIVKGGKSLEESGYLDIILNKFREKHYTIELMTVTSEPEVEQIDAMVGDAKTFGADAVVAIGGGSVLDAAKAVAGLITNGGSIMDYLEGVGSGKTIEKPAIPYIAAPTTAGTGTEVTKNAVISSRKHKFKKSIRHQYLIPRIALVDPELTFSQPKAVTAACGMDALTQLTEPYVSLKSNPFVDAICLQGIKLVTKSLVRAWTDGNDVEARQDMSLASLLGGIALANAGLGAVHGLAAPLGAFFPVPHGVACATILPAAFQSNVNALTQRGDKMTVLKKYAEISRHLTGNHEREDEASIKMGIAWLTDLKKKLNIPSLKDMGITTEDIPFIVNESRGSSMKTNPMTLTDDEIRNILVASM